jgi:hypothetical protein
MSSSEIILIFLLVGLTAGILVSRLFYERERDIVQDRKRVAGEKPWKGAFSAYRLAIDRIQANPLPLLLFLSVTLLATFLSVTIQGKSIVDESYKMYNLLVQIAFILPLPIYALALADGRKIGLREFMRFNLRKLVMLVGVSILIFFIALGSMFLFLLPLIWLFAWFFAAGLVVVDKGATPFQALNESGRLALGHKGKVWGIVGVSFILSIGAGSLVHLPGVGPYVTGILNNFISVLCYSAGAILYRWLQNNQT